MATVTPTSVSARINCVVFFGRAFFLRSLLNCSVTRLRACGAVRPYVRPSFASLLGRPSSTRRSPVRRRVSASDRATAFVRLLARARASYPHLPPSVCPSVRPSTPAPVRVRPSVRRSALCGCAVSAAIDGVTFKSVSCSFGRETFGLPCGERECRVYERERE